MVIPLTIHRCIACHRLGRWRLCDACIPRHYHRLASAPAPAILGDYRGPVGKAVRRVKVRRDTHLADHLCRQAARRMHGLAPAEPWSAIIPAPSLSLTRLTRGFSLASILAGHLGTHTGVPVVHALHKSGLRKQSSLTRDDRFQHAADTIHGRGRIHGRILLVDDVWTTGATASACRCELLRIGARIVDVMALCAVSKFGSISSSRPRIHPRRDEGKMKFGGPQ